MKMLTKSQSRQIRTVREHYSNLVLFTSNSRTVLNKPVTYRWIEIMAIMETQMLTE